MNFSKKIRSTIFWSKKYLSLKIPRFQILEDYWNPMFFQKYHHITKIIKNFWYKVENRKSVLAVDTKIGYNTRINHRYHHHDFGSSRCNLNGISTKWSFFNKFLENPCFFMKIMDFQIASKYTPHVFQHSKMPLNTF